MTKLSNNFCCCSCDENCLYVMNGRYVRYIAVFVSVGVYFGVNGGDGLDI